MKKIIFFTLFILGIKLSVAKTIDDLTPTEQQILLDAKTDSIFGTSVKTAQIFQQFIDSGLEDAGIFEILGESYYKGNGVQRDPNKAVQLYRQSYELNNKSYAAFELGRIYFDQWENYHEAKKWFEITVAQNSHDKSWASFYLGDMYLNGLGVRQDCTKALPYFESSKDTIFESFTNLGIMYSIGCGVEKDTVKAKEYFGQACDKGDQDGCDEYRKLNMLNNK